MYRTCFCVKITQIASEPVAPTDADKPKNGETAQPLPEQKSSTSELDVPPIPPARRQYSQFGQYKHQNYPGNGVGWRTRSDTGAGSSQSTSSGEVTDTRESRMARINAMKKGFDQNNKRIQCEECKHEEYFEWVWDKKASLPTTSVFAEQDRNILFNPGFSVGTGAVRASKPLELGKHHFFEILMNTEVYGTDMMIGVGTDKVNLQQFAHSFVHFLGYNEESWGLSYSGDIHHAGQVRHYTTPFSQGTYIGVHVDMWAGTLEYYINRRPMGKAFTGLQNKTLYPMIASTAARSGMNLTYCRSFTPTLQLQAMLALSQCSFLPQNAAISSCEGLPPGLKSQIKKQYWWIAANKMGDNIFALESNKENQKNGASKQGGTQIKMCRRKKFFASLGVNIGSDDEDSDPGPSSRVPVGGASSSGSSASASVPSRSTSSGIQESHSKKSAGNDGVAGSPESSDSESRDSKRIRLRGASLTQDSD